MLFSALRCASQLLLCVKHGPPHLSQHAIRMGWTIIRGFAIPYDPRLPPHLLQRLLSA